MKAIILAAGIGSRIRPLTDNSPKCLLKVGSKTILERMIDNLLAVNISEFIMVTGYMADTIQSYIKEKYPQLNITYIHNPRYLETNTGYSVLLARDLVLDSDFVKLDGDVVFEQTIIEKLLHSDNPNCLSIDQNIHLAKEEVKVKMDNQFRVLEVGKKLDPTKVQGESIGIEKLSKEAGKVFFEILEEQIIQKQNLQDYYDDSYTTLVERGIPFYSVDISNLKWVEIDTLDDYNNANKIFS